VEAHLGVRRPRLRRELEEVLPALELVVDPRARVAHEFQDVGGELLPGAALGAVHPPRPAEAAPPTALWYRPGTNPDSIWFATSGNRFVDKPFTVNGVYDPI
jgi:hypothetical protein